MLDVKSGAKTLVHVSVTNGSKSGYNFNAIHGGVTVSFM
jgi:hypothetical protein